MKTLKSKTMRNCTVNIRRTTLGAVYVVVECARHGFIHVDIPLLYTDGRIVYDRPEQVPQYIRPTIKRFLEEAKQIRNAG
jgi:hypothetical protein